MVLAHNIEDGVRTQDVQISEGVTFDSMLLNDDTLKGLKDSGFYKPSPIQLHGIPLGKCGFDMLLEAKSGTGKTAVFSVIALEQLNLAVGLQVVILAPTREIASQICDVLKQIGSHFKNLRVEVVMGGLSVQEDIAKFKNDKVHIVVGSPGRLRHLIQDKYINISSVRLLVLDEADKLLEKSFLTDINYIFSVLPKQKQVIMSSATYPNETVTFIKQYVQSAQHICPDSNSILLGIKQSVTLVDYNVNIVKQTKIRFEELLKILSKQPFKQCLIFCNYQARVAELHKMLKRQKWPAEQLYGQQEQLDRLEALKSLQEYKCRILISTDLAARGIDASNVDLVINFEPALDWQTYLHRIGRAGRFGSYGIAITILSKGKEEKKFKDIISAIKAPINFTNWWKDDKITMDNSPACVPSEPSTSESLRSEEKCQNLWDLLKGENKENEDPIEEDFEHLCNSLEKENKVESFSDLISSLEAHQNSNENRTLHPHQEMQNASLPHYLKLNSLVKTKRNLKENLSKNLELNNKSGNTSESQEKSHAQDDIDKRTVPDSREVLDDYYDEFEDSTATQALRDAGLPTSFGKQKLKAKKTRVNKSKYENKFYQNDDTLLEKDENPGENRKNRLSYKETEDSDTSQGFYNIRKENSNCKTKIRVKHSKHNKASKESGYDVDNENYDNGYNTSNYSEPYKTHKPSNTCKTETEYTSDSSAEEESNSAIHSNYINWYNNLKYRVKLVEQAIYIEEMCKP
ncbi:DEAD/DEAH box helicase domain-containing protein [Phthorimaea operculella]|nr:DEAD/DEAH box helicase domain-containing protein [Phthorimaea operculella]